jgi:pilus assembly protein CpaE
MRVLLIDDEPFYYKLLNKPMKDAGHEFEYAKTGKEGLAKVSATKPDVIIVDLRLPDISGHDILERLRRDTEFSNIPVIVITAKNELGDKLKAFELGADDYLIKPFQPEELVARMRILARRGRAMKIVSEMEKSDETLTTIVAVHSLRGGVGTTSVAVNLALAFNQIWAKSTLLIDAVLSAGQVAMMLNAKPRFTWEDFVDIELKNIDEDLIENIASQHSSGLSFIASPRSPIALDTFSDEFWQIVLAKLAKQYEFIVIDTAHDFADITIQMLNSASNIVLALAPEMSSLRAAMSAMNIYDKLGFPSERIKLLLNSNSSIAGIRQTQIEKVLDHPVNFVIPYEPDEVIRAVNFGEPFLLKNSALPISVKIEDMAYVLSNDVHKNLPPAAPTDAWKRVANRLGDNK